MEINQQSINQHDFIQNTPTKCMPHPLAPAKSPFFHRKAKDRARRGMGVGQNRVDNVPEQLPALSSSNAVGLDPPTLLEPLVVISIASGVCVCKRVGVFVAGR